MIDQDAGAPLQSSLASSSSASDSDAARSITPLTQTRPPFWNALRWLANLWWKVFAFMLLGNYLPGAVLATLQGGLSALTAYLTTWGLVQPLEARYPLVFWSTAAALFVLAVLGLGAELDERRGAARAEAKLRQATQEAHATAGRAIATAERALAVVQTSAPLLPVPQPLGPPDDWGALPAPDQFIGREADVTWTLDHLRQDGAIAASRGLGGMGKTALAAVVVRRLHQEGRFPDGIAVVLCQSLTDPAEILRRILTRFDPYRRSPEMTDLSRLSESAQGLLKGKSALVVLDNVEPQLPVTQVVSPLRAAGLTVLLTARQALPGEVVPPEASRALGLLSSDEALTLFASALGRSEGSSGGSMFTPTERAAAQAIVASLGAHTLAVKLAGAYAGSEHRDLSALAREVADPGQGLSLPGDDEAPEAVRRTFELSLDALPEEAQRLFVGLAA
ncbi:MAG TPA: NB-ARC domain-containing protein, partial [Ktedonobacterales bacterium]|nr:NB-ARC domain-containing protein [Ktedonobacterales bacterium]